MKKLRLRAAATAALGLMALASPGLAQTTVTSFAPFSATPAPGTWYEADVRPGGVASVVDLSGVGGNLETSQPLPIGAALLTTDFTNVAKAEVAVPDSYGTAGDIIASLQVGYSWHKAANVGQNNNAAPSIKLTFFNPVCDETAPADCFATLIYEPYVNGFGNFPGQDVWHRSDLDHDTGGWWTSGGFGVANQGGGPPYRTLDGWLAALTPDFAQASLVAVSIGVGSFNPGQIGYFDDVTISHTFGAGFGKSYDFDLGPMVNKQKAVLNLQALLPSGDKKADHSIQKAIKDLMKSLDPDLWLDDSHLTDKGKKVFEDERQAVQELMKVKPPTPIAGIIVSLVEADYTLAQIAIDEAIAGSGDPKHLAKAQEEFGKATDAANAYDYYKAIEHFKKAWHHAMKALNKPVEP